MTLTKLFPMLKTMGLDDEKSQEFIETMENGIWERVATSADVERIRAEMATKVELEKIRADVERIRAEMATKVELEKIRADVERIRAEMATKVELEKVKADLSMDIEKVRGDLSMEIEKVRGDLSTRIEMAKSETLRWVFAAWSTLFLGIIAIIIKVL